MGGGRRLVDGRRVDVSVARYMYLGPAKSEMLNILS